MLKKWLLPIISYLLCAVLACILSIGILANSTSGSAWLVEEFSKLFAKNFHYQKFSGVLLRNFSFTDVQFSHHQFNLAIASLACNWQPLHLLHAHLHIDTLAATQLHVTLLFKKSATHFFLENFLADADLSTQKIQLNGSWKKLHIAATQRWLNVLQLDGVIGVSGSLNHYHWFLHTEQALISGEGSKHNLQITHIQSAFFPKTLSFFASYQWFPNSVVIIQTAGILRPDMWSNKYQGQLALDIKLYAKDFLQATAVYALQIKKLQGRLQQHQIDGAGQFVWSKDALSWHNFHIQVAHSLLEINGVLGKMSDLLWHIHIDDLAYWLPDSDGAIFSAGQLSGNWQNPKLQANIHLNALRLMGVSLHRLHVKAQANEQTANADLSLQTLLYKNIPVLESMQGHFLFNRIGKKANLMGNIISNWGRIIIQCGFPEWGRTIDWLGQPLFGNVQWQLHTIPSAWVNSAIENLQGALFAQAKITGTLGAPKLNLVFRLHDVSMKMIKLNLLIKNMRVAIDGFVDQTLKILADADLTEGHVQITGEVAQLFADPTFWLKIAGNKLFLMDVPMYKIWVSPQLHLMYQKQNLKLTGTVSIPKAKIKLIDYGKTVVPLSPDVIYADTHQSALHLFADLSLTLGEAVEFHYGGLSGLLRGHLALQTSPNMDTTAVGKIHLLNGLYVAYGQVLHIQKGLAVFHGDVINPELTIKATKLIENAATMGASLPGYAVMTNPDGSLIVGVLISGPVKHYQVNLFSTPSGLNQTDILSYLILGMPAQSAGGQGGQILLSAASALMDKNNGELGPLAQLKNQLQETLGVSVNVGQIAQYNTDKQLATPNTGLILTKRLSPKLSIRYSAGMAQSTNQFEVRYQINKNWLTQTNSSSLGNGGDVFYTINR